MALTPRSEARLTSIIADPLKFVQRRQKSFSVSFLAELRPERSCEQFRLPQHLFSSFEFLWVHHRAFAFRHSFIYNLRAMASSTAGAARGSSYRQYNRGSSSSSIENLPPRTLARVAREVRDLHKIPPEGVRLVVDSETGVPSSLGEVLVSNITLTVRCCETIPMGSEPICGRQK